MKKLTTTSILLVALTSAAPVAAQDAPSQAPAPAPAEVQQAPAAPAKPPAVNLNDMRHHIYVMEGALARAVDYGAKQLNREILAVMPGVFMLEGEARARGVYLDAYGVFFDVRVPMMRQSMIWTTRLLMDQQDVANQAVINDIRRSMAGITDPSARASLEKALGQLERQAPGALPRSTPVAPSMVMPEATASPVGAAAASGIANPRPAQLPPADSVWTKDPNRAYTEAVTRALVDAMIDYSAPMKIAHDQWLTVAARDDEGRDSLAPQDPLDEVVTMIYRIKGSDLQEYRAGRIDRDEVRKRVQISQF